MLTQTQIDDFARDGAVMIPGLFADWVDDIRAGIDRNMAEPGPYAAENLLDGEAGRFFDDYCNWQRINTFEQVIRSSDAAEVGAELMQSFTAQRYATAGQTQKSSFIMARAARKTGCVAPIGSM